MSTNGQGDPHDTPRLAALRAKVSQAEAARDAAKSALTDEDRAEIALRDRLRAAEEERESQESAKRRIDLDRREEEARAAHPQAKIASTMIKGYPDTFVIKHEPKAHARWKRDVSELAMGNKKLSREDIDRAYAAASIIDWNGITDFLAEGHKLIDYLRAHPGMATPIVNLSIELSGAAVEDRKSEA